MKKVLVISSSPRKNGNSDLLAREFERGAREAGNEVEFVSLREKKIGYCLACNYCHSHGNVCAVKDDMAGLLEKLQWADVYALATPVYYYNVSAQMKTFIDRTFARFFELKDKELYYLATCTDPGKASIDGALMALQGFEVCLPGAACKGVVYGVGNPGHGDIQGKPELNEAYEMGKNV